MWQTLRQHLKPWRSTLIIAPSIAGLVIAGSVGGAFSLLEWDVLDRFFLLRPTEPIDDRIVIVTIDEDDIEYVKQWPMNDRVMAQLIRNIRTQNPRAIGLDIYRDLAVEPGHEELVEVFESTPELIGIEKVAPAAIAPAPVLAELGQVAANDYLLDSDGKIRRGFVLVGSRVGLGVQLAMMYLQPEGIELELRDKERNIYGLGQATFNPLTKNDGEYTDKDMGGYQILINYRGSTDKFPTISLQDVLEDRIPPDLMNDRVVLIGAVAPSLNDSWQTPHRRTLFGSIELMPGVTIHANVISQVLNAALSDRPMLRATPKPLNWSWIVIWSGYSAALGAICLRRRWAGGAIVLGGLAIISTSYLAFLGGWIVPAFTPGLALVGSAVVSIGYTLWNNLRRSYRQLAEYAQTLEVKNEELKRLDQLKDEFLANTSHELRTPLNGTIGIVESMLDGATGPLAPLQEKNLWMVVQSSHRLSNLVNDILDFSKLKNHGLELQQKSIDLWGMANTILAFNQVLVTRKDLQLVNLISKSLSPAYADENRLQQIFHNLVGNAIKFTESGRVEVSAKTIEDRQLAITVSDTGIGIREDRLDRIFESFEQGDGSTDRQYGGTGLGLAVTQQLVELHGGQLWVESEVGVGSQFTFTLPMADIPAQEMSSVPTTVRRPIPNLTTPSNSASSSAADSDGAIATQTSNEAEGNFHILIVDDEPINIQVLQNHLSVNHYRVTEALNGAEALAALENEETFDLVLLDVMMPQMSGYEVCAKIREKYPPQELPIVMLTAKNQITDLVTGFQYGANDYLTKPFVKDELLTRIKTHIKLANISNAYGRFVPHEYLYFLSRESILDVKLGDHISKEMAVMFSDIRSFTTLAESMTPQESFNFVNAYLREVSPEIRKNNGLVVKYLGDGVMAVFPDRADDAVAAGIAKLNKVRDYNQRRLKAGYQPIKIGIGIHIGNVMVGIVGESGRMEGDALSDNVNLTARLEGLTKFYGVSLLISEQVVNKMHEPEKYQLRFLDRAIVKGRSEPISVYEVLEGETEETRELKLKTQPDFERGVEFYRRGELEPAKEFFDRVLQVNSLDKTAQLYLERIERLEKFGLPEQWNGTWRFTEK